MKNVVITGAGGNLGKIVVDKFLKTGFRVLATVSPGKELTGDFKGDLHVYPVDLTNEKSVDTFTDFIIAEHGTINTALMLAGGFAAGELSKTSANDLQKMYSLNFETAFYMARNLHRHMLEGDSGGRLVFMGSKPSLVPKDARHAVAYALAKSLLFRYAELLNAEGQHKGVIAAVVVPGVIDTPTNREAMPQANFSTWVSAEDIAFALHYLCTEKGASLNDPILKMYGSR
ncbi:MAG: SDR family NAD(P)-dependent oxidoreductase [Cyclobacteriaceae bacterium]|nr:SDR family NAD(P)-dependent oxidoreductase [Cyclobacteriaceae bacterium]